MKKERIEELRNSFQSKADRAYSSYQATGITRYDTEHRRNEDIAEALGIALNAADTASAATGYKVELVDLASRAERALHNGEDTTTILKDLVAYAATCCGYRRVW